MAQEVSGNTKLKAEVKNPNACWRKTGHVEE